MHRIHRVTMREALREAAEAHKGVAALAGAFVAGGLMVSALTGAIQTPGQNTARLDTMEVALESIVEDQRFAYQRLQRQVSAVVVFVETQAMLNCSLMSQLLEDIDVNQCRSIPGVPTLPDPGGGDG